MAATPRAGLRRDVLAALALAPLLLGARCGPTDQEAGGAVVLALPVMIAAGTLLLWGLNGLWRHALDDLTWRPGPALAGIAGSGVIAAMTAIALADTDAARWVGMALVAAGSSYLALLLVVWRLWMVASPARAFAWAWLPAAVLQLVTGAAAATDAMGDGAMDVLAVVWIIPGYWGIPTLALLLGVALEAAIRAHRAR